MLHILWHIHTHSLSHTHMYEHTHKHSHTLSRIKHLQVLHILWHIHTKSLTHIQTQKNSQNETFIRRKRPYVETSWKWKRLQSWDKTPCHILTLRTSRIFPEWNILEKKLTKHGKQILYLLESLLEVSRGSYLLHASCR